VLFFLYVLYERRYCDLFLRNITIIIICAKKERSWIEIDAQINKKTKTNGLEVLKIFVY